MSAWAIASPKRATQRCFDMAVTTALVATAATTAYAANRSNAAADKQVKATQSGIEQTSAMAEQSRRDAIQLYNQGRQTGQRGLTSAFNFYKQSAPARYSPITQTGIAAQRVIGQGAQQANNAILGLPVDMGFANPQQVNPDLSFLQGAQLPELTGEYLPANEPDQGAPIGAGIAGQVAQNAVGARGGRFGGLR